MRRREETSASRALIAARRGRLPPTLPVDCSLGQMAANHVGYLRKTLGWAGIEYAPHQYNFAGVDALVTALARHHMRLLPIVLGAPSWLSTQPKSGGDRRDLSAAFSGAVRDLRGAVRQAVRARRVVLARAQEPAAPPDRGLGDLERAEPRPVLGAEARCVRVRPAARRDVPCGQAGRSPRHDRALGHAVLHAGGRGELPDRSVPRRGQAVLRRDGPAHVLRERRRGVPADPGRALGDEPLRRPAQGGSGSPSGDGLADRPTRTSSQPAASGTTSASSSA